MSSILKRQNKVKWNWFFLSNDLVRSSNMTCFIRIINPSKTFSNVNSSAGEADWGVEVICGEEGRTSDHAAGCEDEVSKLKLEEKNWIRKKYKATAWVSKSKLWQRPWGRSNGLFAFKMMGPRKMSLWNLPIMPSYVNIMWILFLEQKTILFLCFTGGCGDNDGHHQGVPFQSCYDGALTNAFFIPTIYIFCSQNICNYCERS